MDIKYGCSLSIFPINKLVDNQPHRISIHPTTNHKILKFGASYMDNPSIELEFWDYASLVIDICNIHVHKIFCL